MEAYDNGILTVTYEGKNSREVLRQYLLSIPSGRVRKGTLKTYRVLCREVSVLTIYFTQEFCDEIEKYNQLKRTRL